MCATERGTILIRKKYSADSIVNLSFLTLQQQIDSLSLHRNITSLYL